MENDLTAILEFLSSLHLAGISFNTINIHRSMLSMTLDHIDGSPIGRHSLVVRLLKGCYNQNPPRPKYSALWDVETVFNFMRSSEDNLSLNISSLTKKLATLLAISTLLRSSELSSLEKESIVFSDAGANLTLAKPKKSQTSGPLRSVLLANFIDSKVCPVKCLKAYIFFTDFLRTPENKRFLFISLIQPFGPVSGNTVGRWIKSFLDQAGIDVTQFSAHSTRGAAASKAVASGHSIDSILRAGDWSRESTFAKHYHRVLLPVNSGLNLAS